MSEPIKVLQMIASMYMGGSQAMIMNLYRNIDRNKIQFDFVVDHPEYDSYASEIESLGGKVYTMPVFNGRNFNQVKKAWNELFLEHPEYKILHSHARSYASIYLPVASKNGVKTIIHSHNTSNGTGIKAMVKNTLQYPLRYQADYYFGCSKDAGRWLFGNKIVNSDRFYVLNNAIDALSFRFNEDIRNKYRKDYNINNETIYIQVGSLTDQKNHVFTIDIFNKLSKINKNIKLYIVGTGNNQKMIERRIKEYDLEDKIILLGRRNDVNNLLQMADCYIMPSIYEGLSVAAIEAQASGITCLLSDVVSKDVKVSDVCEFLPLDIDKWVDRLNCSFTRKDTYEDIVKAGYDVKTTARWLEDFYQSII